LIKRIENEAKVDQFQNNEKDLLTEKDVNELLDHPLLENLGDASSFLQSQDDDGREMNDFGSVVDGGYHDGSIGSPLSTFTTPVNDARSGVAGIDNENEKPTRLEIGNTDARPTDGLAQDDSLGVSHNQNNQLTIAPNLGKKSL
jgi:hypothetical protein